MKREYQKLWRDRNKEKCAEYSANYRLRHPERSLLIQARNRAKRLGLECTIEESDVVIPEICPVFGFRLKFNLNTGNGGKYDSPSLDRINNNKGYVPGNIRVISYLANTMKRDASPEQLTQFAKWALS